jgi:hypothetical protein
MVSQAFKNALKIQPIPKYQLAWKTGITPNIFNHLLHEHIRVQPGDERLLKIARLINFPEDKVFDKERIGD